LSSALASPSGPDPLLPPPDVAELLSVSERRLEYWRYQGRGPAFMRLGRRTVRYRLSDVEAFLEANRQGGDASQ
jgi:predicted DNA-binding transcriptional regulator AlpA